MLVQLLSAAAEAESTSAGTTALFVGGGIMAFFLLALLVTTSYTNVGRRHDAHAEIADTHRQHSNKHGHH